MTGYLHSDYAQSLSEFGEPLYLPKSGGWLLKRPLDNTQTDAMGPYPLFACSDWKSLKYDFAQLRDSLVSVILVTDPFGEYDESLLRDCFGDLVLPFKSHFINDFTSPSDNVISQHHARNAAVGLKQLIVERCEHPFSHLDDWVSLYSVLVQRHQITGIRAFSKNSFARQLNTPGIVAFRALRNLQIVGMILWYVQNGVAYYQLGAYSDEGYQSRASFALFRHALDYFSASGLRYASLGAGAGLDTDADDGLSRFKRGWSTSVRPTYLCGRIFDRQRYHHLVRARNIGDTLYFPAYRKGEFN
jgi:hypothetical protein